MRLTDYKIAEQSNNIENMGNCPQNSNNIKRKNISNRWQNTDKTWIKFESNNNT